MIRLSLMAALLAGIGGCRRANPAYHGGGHDGEAGAGGAESGPDVAGGAGGDGAGLDSPPDLPIDPEVPETPKPDLPPDLPPEGPLSELPPGCTSDDDCAPAFCNDGTCEGSPHFKPPAILPMDGGAVLCPAGGEPGFPAISADGSEIIYSCQWTTGWDLYASLRNEDSGKWKKGVLLSGINGAADYPLPSQISRDGTTFYFARYAGSTSDRDLVQASRSGPGSIGFGSYSYVPGASSGNEDNAIWLDPAGTSAYVSSKRWSAYNDCSHDTDIYTAMRSGAGAMFSGFARLVPPSSSAFDSKPALPDHMRFMVFHRASTDCTTSTHDLYLTWRATTAKPWSDPMPLVELNTSAPDLWPSLTANGQTIVFGTRRTGGVSEIWVATRW